MTDMTDFSTTPPTGPPPLRRAVTLGSFWMVGMRWSLKLIGLVNTIVLARLLAPGDFGLVAMAMVVAGFVEILFEFGVNMALIQNDRATRDHFDSAWTLRIIQSTLAASLMAAGAPLAARYYDDPRVIPILLVIALSTLAKGFTNIGIVAFSKELRFGWEYAFRVTAKILAIVATITLALLLRNYWALVLGTVVATVLQVVLSYRIHPFRPRLSLKAIGDIWSFSQWMLVIHLSNYMTWKVDRLLIGGLATPRILGLYTVGGELAQMPSAELVAPLSRSLVPGFAKLKRHADRLRRAFLNSMNATVSIGVPAGVGVFLIAPLVVPIVLGDKWIDAVPVVRILALYAVTRVLFSTASNLGMVTGKIRSLAVLAVARSVVFLSSIYWAFTWRGIEGVAIAKLAIGVLSAVAVNWLVTRSSGIRARQLLGQCWRPIVASAAMAVAVGILEANVPSAEPLPGLLMMVATGVAAYGVVLLLVWLFSGRPDGIERAVWRFLRERSGSRRQPVQG